MSWSDRSAEFRQYSGRKLKQIPLQRQMNIPGTCMIGYAGFDDQFIVRTESGEYLVRASFGEIKPYLMEEEVKA